MRSLNSIITQTIAPALLCVIGLAATGLAATKPLAGPAGLAVDSKGNLYVANFGGNEILVYNTSYVQITAKTITENINYPAGVAFDPAGNLWVANLGTSNGGPNGSVAEYTNGVQNTSNSITNGILGPNAIAIDHDGNIWVANGYANVTVYGRYYAFLPPTTLITTITPQGNIPVYSIAVGHGVFAWASDFKVWFAGETDALVNNNIFLFSNPIPGAGDPNCPPECPSMAIDANGNIYYGDFNGDVNFEAGDRTVHPFLSLSFAPWGIAVDDVHKRIYFSNTYANSISVYSLSGTLLHVIE
jgi:DNA-binding beta-propeller fold protein YncE